MKKSVIVRIFNNRVVSSNLMIDRPEFAEYITSHDGYDVFLAPMSDTKDIPSVTNLDSFQQFLIGMAQTMQFVERMAAKYGSGN